MAVLDGASAFGSPGRVSGGAFAENLGRSLVDEMDESSSLTTVLVLALRKTIAMLGLPFGSPDAPSSTVAVIRARTGGFLDLLALGDSTIVLGYRDGTQEIICDDRLERLGLPQSGAYRSRLQRGGGYNDEHRELLVELQQEQRRRRNRPGGYWIASTVPEASRHAITMTRSMKALSWVALATDGVTDPLEALGYSWPEVAALNSNEMADLLSRLQQWEAETDPCGVVLPRAKRHDDKTLIVAAV
ncbi:protein phosphatase 2C domain-containing protein [Nocardia sp. CC227C]|uniref:protein phosphatase 2C domain-containing protein n=1 Tax=Nocardia sp. CC227C TaxID=3044562 RepID=UPI00278C3D17|nr:protein phosphatase 2C domain-containing protein [Nocardia sp. CC227C]